MGCGASVRKGKDPNCIQYFSLRQEVFQTKEYKFLDEFQNKLWPTACGVIKLAKNFDNTFKQIDELTEAIQNFGQFDILKPVTDVLCIIPQFFKPMVQKARLPVFAALSSALEFAKKYWDFHQDLAQLFKLLKGMEKKKSIINKRDMYKNACHIMKCLREKLHENIKVIKVNEENMNALKSIVSKVSTLKKIAGPVVTLKKFLTKSVMGVSVLSLLGGQLNGVSGVIVKTTIKGMMIPIKKAVSTCKVTSQIFQIFEFPLDVCAPESGWLGLHYALDSKRKKLDVFKSLPKQWVIDNLQDQYFNVMQDYQKSGSGDQIEEGEPIQQEVGSKKQERKDNDKDLIFSYTLDQIQIEEMMNKGRESIEQPSNIVNPENLQKMVQALQNQQQKSDIINQEEREPLNPINNERIGNDIVPVAA